MHAIHVDIYVSTSGKGTYEITSRLESALSQSAIQSGQLTVFNRHTSASLILYENADRSARVDLEAYFDRLVPEDAEYFTHTLEGPDDMPGHLRMVLTRSSETIPVRDGRLQLGTWQGVFLFEHRAHPHRRHLVVTIMGQ